MDYKMQSDRLVPRVLRERIIYSLQVKSQVVFSSFLEVSHDICSMCWMY